MTRAAPRTPARVLDTLAKAMVPVAIMRSRLVVTLVLLALLLLLPPVAMALHSCAGMGQMCEAPCGATAGVAVAPTDSTTLDLVTGLELQPAPLLPAIFALSSDPPPKF